MPAPKRLMLLAAIVAVALLVPGSAGPAPRAASEPVARTAQVPSGFFGLGGWRWPRAGEIRALSARGVRSWRVTMSWADIQPRRGRYLWSGYDQLLRRLASRRISVFFALAACPHWACGRHGLGPPRTAAAKAAWYAFVRAAVRRYGGNGSFWRRRPGLPQLKVRYWQVMNEVNGRDQWPRPSARAYAALLRPTAAAIRGADSGSKVVLAGLGEKMTIWLRRYLPALYRQPGFAGAVDVIAVEGYAPRGRHVGRILRTTRRIMRRYRDSRTPVWITEMSWATGGGRHAFVTSERGQSRRLKQAFDLILRRRRAWNLQRVYWFPHTDRPSPRGQADYWGNHNGLITVGGRWKPAMWTFLRYAR